MARVNRRWQRSINVVIAVLIAMTGVFTTTRISVLAFAPDGSGTMTASPTSVAYHSTGNTITLTYTAASGGTSSGAISIVVPTGWSAPSKTGSNAGFTTASKGTVAVSGQTITVSSVTLSSGATDTITYGSKASSGPGATAPATAGSATWTTKEKSTSSGTLTALASSPSITVLSQDGSGTLTSTTSNVGNGSTGNTITFTYTAATGGISNGTVTVVVPSGWTAPSTTGANAGYTTATTGTVSVASQTITVSGVTLTGGSTFTITYGSTASSGPGATATTTAGPGAWVTKEQSTSGGTLTAIGTSPSINVYSADGSGTLTSNTANVGNGSTGNTITFTYTAATGGMGTGSVSVVVPSGWSAPSTTGSNAGYTTSSTGSVSVASQTITVSSVTLAANATLTITYGSKASSGPGATAPTTAGSATWSGDEASTSGGTLTALASSPGINVYAGDGTGTLTTTTSNVGNGSTGNTITFTYTASTGGMSGGSVTVTAPSGWSAPSTTGSNAGYTTASAGTVSVASQTITVSGVTLAANGTFTITYGSTASSGPGATASTTGGSATWSAQEKSTSGGGLTNLTTSPSINVYAADGTGTMTTNTSNVLPSSAGNTLTFTYTAAAGGISNGTVTLVVPSGWSAPSTTGSNAGYTTATSGSVAASSQTITVSGLTLSANGTVTITYGSKASSGPGATGPSSLGAQNWTVQEKSTSGGTLTTISPVTIDVSSSSYTSAVLTDTPSVYYRLDELSGTSAADSSGNGVTGTYASSGITYGVSSALTSDSDFAVTTAGSGATLTASDTTLPGSSTARTVELWEKGTSGGFLFGYGTGGSNDAFALQVNNATQMTLWTSGGGGPAVDVPYSILDGFWHQVAVSYDPAGNLITWYVDGQELGTSSVSTLATDLSNQFVLGAAYNVSAPFTGSIDELSVYSSTLSAAHINTHWAAGVQESCPTTPTTGYPGAVTSDSPVRYLRLGETSGRYAADYSSHCTPAAYNSSATHVSGGLVGDGDGAVGSAATPTTTVSVSTSGLPGGSTDRTVEAWGKALLASMWSVSCDPECV